MIVCANVATVQLMMNSGWDTISHLVLLSICVADWIEWMLIALALVSRSVCLRKKRINLNHLVHLFKNFEKRISAKKRKDTPNNPADKNTTHPGLTGNLTQQITNRLTNAMTAISM